MISSTLIPAFAVCLWALSTSGYGAQPAKSIWPDAPNSKPVADVEVPLQRDEVQAIVREMRRLQSAGAKLRAEYPNVDDLTTLKACAAKSHPLREQAKPLRQRAFDLKRITYRGDLMRAADDTFVCVFCGGDANSCARVPPILASVERRLAIDK